MASTGRYVVTAPVATAEQQDLLSVVTTIDFPSNVTTVGDAVESLLIHSGYKLTDDNRNAPPLTLPLPTAHRRLGPITLEHAMQTLAGEPWEAIYDPVHRLVTYALRAEYQPPPVSTASVSTASSQTTMSVDLVRVSDFKSPKSPGAFVVADASEARFLFPEPSSSKDAYSLDPTVVQAHDQYRAAVLSDHITPDIRGLQLKEAFETILPGWRIDLFLSDPEIANARINLTTEGTRESLLDVLEDRLYTKYGVFLYRFSNRHPPVLIITDERP